MTKQLILVFIAFFAISCTDKEKVDFDYVNAKFKENSQKIKVVEYSDHRIDSSMAQNVFWNNKGKVLIEKRERDSFFGFSFYGKRSDIDKDYLYDNDNGFEISHQLKNYTIEHPYSIIGSPGGQLTVNQIFHLDSVYKKAEMIEKADKYILKYTFEPDTIYNVTDQTRIIELRKEDFFPTKITYRGKRLGKSTMSQHILSEIKINNEVKTSIKDIKNKISNYDVVQETKGDDIINPILNKKFPAINLPNLSDTNQQFKLKKDKVTLIDFWEVWCGPCIKSFPEVEKLNKKYKKDLQIIGIVTESEESAVKLIEKKGVTFTNLLGNKSVHEEYGVNSYPRYFLLDKNGIVKKEYYGFSEEIENEIKTMIAE